jgi:uncharacterized protein (DUF433 family)
MRHLARITFDSDVMGGKPCIRGMRVTVGTLVWSRVGSAQVKYIALSAILK